MGPWIPPGQLLQRKAGVSGLPSEAAGLQSPDADLEGKAQGVGTEGPPLGRFPAVLLPVLPPRQEQQDHTSCSISTLSLTRCPVGGGG